MSEFAEIEKEYEMRLMSYIDDASESALAAAASIGKKALLKEMGVLDMVLMHHACLARLLVTEGSTDDRRRILDRSATFFCEAISSYEMAHRGFLELSRSFTQVIQFASVVCHELRTPLTSILTSLGMLHEVLAPGPQGVPSQLLANIDRSAQILKVRTDDLLDLVAFQSGTLSLQFVQTDVGVVVRNIKESMSARALNAGMELRCAVPEELPSVLADPVRLEQIIGNLVDNALKYGADGGRIDLRVYHGGSDVVVEVQDYGSGVSLWDQMNIFQPNFRGTRKNDDVPGIGIGLALCKELVTRHGGNLRLESEEGRGSLFRVTLPIQSRIGSEGKEHESSHRR